MSDWLKLVWLILLLSCGLSACDRAATPSESVSAAAADTPLEHARKHQNPKYVCPMHPQIVRDAAGSCPICGMDLVLKTPQEDTASDSSVRVSGAMRQAMNLRTAPVERGTLWKYIKTIGLVAYDEDRLVHVHPRASGWVEKLRVRAEGEAVQQGNSLLDLYSPEILNAQVDFLIALKQSGGVAASSTQMEKARNRLRLLDLPETIISKLERKQETSNTVPMLAPRSGVVTALSIREGMYVTPQTEMFTLADLSRVWVMVDVFEQQLAWVETGKTAEMRVPAYPGKVWEGKVDYLYPDLDPKTRTLRVRLRFDNPDQLLKPNMFADVVIYGGPTTAVLNLPRQAVISTGRGDRVVKALGDGEFQVVEVRTGMRQGEKVEILSGVREGDQVVVSGQFLLDSEANIQASFARLAE